MFNFVKYSQEDSLHLSPITGCLNWEIFKLFRWKSEHKDTFLKSQVCATSDENWYLTMFFPTETNNSTRIQITWLTDNWPEEKSICIDFEIALLLPKSQDPMNENKSLFQGKDSDVQITKNNNVHGMSVGKAFDNYYEALENMNTNHDKTPLKVLAEVTYWRQVNTSEVMDFLDFPKFRLAQLREFKNLVNDPKSSDFKILCEDVEFLVHRSVLASRSRYFEKVIDDVDPNRFYTVTNVKKQILQEVLRFIYSAEIDDANVEVMELLDAGKKFQLEALKEMCGKRLFPVLNEENLEEYVRFADAHDVMNMKMKYLEFIKKEAFEALKQTKERLNKITKKYEESTSPFKSPNKMARNSKSPFKSPDKMASISGATFKSPKKSPKTINIS